MSEWIESIVLPTGRRIAADEFEWQSVAPDYGRPRDFAVVYGGQDFTDYLSPQQLRLIPGNTVEQINLFFYNLHAQLTGTYVTANEVISSWGTTLLQAKDFASQYQNATGELGERCKQFLSDYNNNALKWFQKVISSVDLADFAKLTFPALWAESAIREFIWNEYISPQIGKGINLIWWAVIIYTGYKLAKK